MNTVHAALVLYVLCFCTRSMLASRSKSPELTPVESTEHRLEHATFFETTIPMHPTGSSRLRNLIEAYSSGLSSYTLSLESRRFTVLKFIEKQRSSMESAHAVFAVKAARRLEERLFSRIAETGEHSAFIVLCVCICSWLFVVSSAVCENIHSKVVGRKRSCAGGILPSVRDHIGAE
jgi:hypothetical protein